MAHSTTPRFPVIRLLVGIVAVFVILNTPARMSVAGKPTKLFTRMVSRDMHTADFRMAAAILHRGWPLSYESVDGGEFISKEGNRLFAFSDSSPSSFWQRVSLMRLSANIFTIAAICVATVLAAQTVFRRPTRHEG